MNYSARLTNSKDPKVYTPDLKGGTEVKVYFVVDYVLYKGIYHKNKNYYAFKECGNFDINASATGELKPFGINKICTRWCYVEDVKIVSDEIESEQSFEEVSQLEYTISLYEKDLIDAAGELMVDVPEPGSEKAKMLFANKILRNRNQEFLSKTVDLKHNISELKESLEMCKSYISNTNVIESIERTLYNLK